MEGLMALCYRRGWRTWKRDFGVEVDEVNNIFSITTRHFSIFGLFTPIVGDLSNIIVYPNGVYIYLITNDKGNKRTGKLAVIK